MRNLIAALGTGLAAASLLVPAVTSADPEPTPADLHGSICTASAPDDQTAPARAILAGYGTGGFTITATPQAQAYFTNGMQLAHAFAHKASIAAFEEASRLDPSCAMCVWGEAWARGPTINYTIDGAAQDKLVAMADKAAGLLRPDASDRDRRLVAAMQKRYRRGGGKGPGDLAFARDMDALAVSYPTDNEIAIIAADAWMIPSAQRLSRDNLPRAMTLLKAALDRAPDDTGAIHFYIHATEMDGVWAEALPYAKRLAALAPKASHLNHMPSHTFYLVGLYHQAVQANVEAVALDDANARRLKLSDGAFGLSYHAHNMHFGMASAMIDGDRTAALNLADDVVAHTDKLKPQTSYGAHLLAMAYAAQGRYADPAKVLAMPRPEGAGAANLMPLWRYARGEALARQGSAAGVRAEAAALDSSGLGSPVVQVAKLILTGRAAMLAGRPLDAARAYRAAAEIQDAKFPHDDDPAVWWYPIRRSLAAALLEAGRPQAAMVEAGRVLKIWPDDPLTLLIQSRAEARLGHAPASEALLARARAGWTGDPTQITAALL